MLSVKFTTMLEVDAKILSRKVIIMSSSCKTILCHSIILLSSSQLFAFKVSRIPSKYSANHYYSIVHYCTIFFHLPVQYSTILYNTPPSFCAPFRHPSVQYSIILLYYSAIHVCNILPLSCALFLCPTREILGMLMSSLSLNVHMCEGVVRKGDIFGVGQGAEWGWKIGQLILSLGLAWVEVRILIQYKGQPPQARGLF